jgi:hypothetical protein
MPTSLQTIVYIPNDGKGVALYAAIMIMYLFRPNLKVELYLLYWKNGLNK